MTIAWSERQSGAVDGNVMRTRPAALRRLLIVGLLGSFVFLAGCPYYAPPPGTVVMVPASFDRSFAAASGAMRDQGLTITTEDSASGTIVGGLAGDTVTAAVHQQADGTVVVQFHSRDARDPALLQRVSNSFDRRMGR